MGGQHYAHVLLVVCRGTVLHQSSLRSIKPCQRMFWIASVHRLLGCNHGRRDAVAGEIHSCFLLQIPHSPIVSRVGGVICHKLCATLIIFSNCDVFTVAAETPRACARYSMQNNLDIVRTPGRTVKTITDILERASFRTR